MKSEEYGRHGIRHALNAAIKKAGCGHWFLYQLRHSFATEIERRFDLKAASLLLGHQSQETTSIYVDPDVKYAIEIVKQL